MSDVVSIKDLGELEKLLSGDEYAVSYESSGIYFMYEPVECIL